MFRRKNSKNSADSEAESPWISFADLMAGFLVVILLALAAAIIMLTLEKASLRQQRIQFEAELVEAEKARQQATDALAEANAALLRAQKSEEAAQRAREYAIQISKDFISLFEELRASQLEIDKTVKQMDNYDQRRRKLLESMQAGLAEQKIKVEISSAGDIMHISEDNLSFDLGQYGIAERFKPTMEAIGAEVASKLKSDAGQIIDTVFVEGHTDNVPNRSEMGNWGLSSYRAISLWDFWGSCPPPAGDLKGLTNSDDRALFSVSGYGETRPLQAFPKHFDGDQRINRRIDLRFNLQTAKKDLLTELSREVTRSTEKFEQAKRELQQKLENLDDNADRR